MPISKLGQFVLVCVLAEVVSGPMRICEAQARPSQAPRAASGKIGKKGIQSTPESLLGERLFLETRFAQYFAAHSNGDINAPLAEGDAVVARVINPLAGVPYRGPFAGKSINCRSCHFVDEFSAFIAGTNRSYTDYVPRSPVPAREDGQKVTPRNSRSLVDAFLPGRAGNLLHADGEFSNAKTLVESTFTGRNFGWLPAEQKTAVHHIANVVREDDGRDALGQEYGGSYAKLMLGTAPDIPDRLRIASSYRMDVRTATDQQILDEIARLVGAYLNSLLFERNAEGFHTGSPYDMFLAKNGLPLAPAAGETDAQYSRRLLVGVEQLQHPKFVQPYERWSRFHQHVFQFREQELAGLKIFLRQGSTPVDTQKVTRRVSPLFILAGLPLLGVLLGKRRDGRRVPSDWVIATVSSMFLCALLAATMSAPGIERVQAASDSLAPESVTHVGNCVSCHAAPEFTDFRFHNTGASQEEYDAVHGPGSFVRLAVPSFAERSRHPDRYLPATPEHPRAAGVFRAVPSVNGAAEADLGMWNIFANSDFPEVQGQMRDLLCNQRKCDPNRELPKTIALFRTPSLRDLGHAAPYLHTGRMASIEAVLRFYVRTSGLARGGLLRNADPELSKISLDDEDVAALAAFLSALDEDYDN